MASDDRQKKTVDEALCSLRSLIAGDETIHSGDKIDADEFHHALQRIAAEIEAAWKRERAEIEAQALSIGGIVESSRHKQKPQGNAAATREALEYVIQWREDCISEEGADNVDDMMAVVNAALSAPARNCDRGKAPRELLEDYISEKGFSSPNQIGAIHELALPVVEWLVMTAEKRKGENDGR